MLVLLALLLIGCRAEVGGRGAVGALAVRHAVVVAAPGGGSQASAFLELENHGAAPVTLVGVRSPAAETAEVHGMTGGRMYPSGPLRVPAGARLRLGPGGYHVMLDGLVRPLAVGDSVPLELRFAPGATLRLRAPVLRYSEAVDAVTP